MSSDMKNHSRKLSDKKPMNNNENKENKINKKEKM